MMQFVLKWGLKTWMTIFIFLCIQYVYYKLLTGIPFNIVFTILYFVQEENLFYNQHQTNDQGEHANPYTTKALILILTYHQRKAQTINKK